MVEKIEQTDIQVPKKEIKQEETLDNILQSKISDQTTLQKAKPIFEEVQKSFQQPINDYIKNLDDFKIDYIINIEQDPVKYLIENIDIKNGIKIIDVTKNKVIENKDKVIENKDKVIENKDKVIENKDKVIENKDKVIENKDKVIETGIDKKENQILLESRKATKQSYDKLNDKDKITDEQLQKEKANIPQIVIDAVNKKTQGTEFKADEFLKFYLIGEKKENKNKPEYKDFMKNYEALKISLEIPEAMSLRESTKPENIDILVNNNKGLREKADSLDISAPKLPETEDFDTEFDTYVKLIPDEDIRKNIEKNREIIQDYRAVMVDEEEARDIEARSAYEEYMTAVEEVQETLPNRIQTIVKQRVMGSCITGIKNYLDDDATSIYKNNFVDNLDTNTQDGYQIQKGTETEEKDDDILYINGNIKGNKIGFYYNLTNPDAQLQSDDFLHSNQDLFTLGGDGGGRNSLGVKLPTINLLSAQAQGVSERNFTELLNKSTSLEDFESSFKNTISNELLKNYGQEALVKTRVERDVEKNITAQTLNSVFIPEAVLTQMNQNKSIDKITEKRARKLMEIRDTSTENMRSDELRRFRGLIERLDPLISDRAEKPQGNLPNRRQSLLEGIEDDRGAENYSDDRGKSTLKFFKKFSKNGQMDLQDLEVFVSGLEKKENISDNMPEYSRDFQTDEERQEADTLLEKIENIDNTENVTKLAIFLQKELNPNEKNISVNLNKNNNIEITSFPEGTNPLSKINIYYTKGANNNFSFDGKKLILGDISIRTENNIGKDKIEKNLIIGEDIGGILIKLSDKESIT